MKDINHVGIILDGNRRWAKSQGKRPEYGHKMGAENLEEFVKKLNKEKIIKYLSVYIFSTENWKRSKREVNYLMSLFKIYFKSIMKNSDTENIKIIFSGSDKNLSENLKKMKYEIIEKTKNNTGLVLNLCFNYGGRVEIIETIQNMFEDIKSGKIEKEDITEEYISSKIYTKDIPDPDLIIRTSGEQRLSNFLMWQGSYSELYFIRKHWPEFKIEDLKNALDEYNNRERRFGGK